MAVYAVKSSRCDIFGHSTEENINRAPKQEIGHSYFRSIGQAVQIGLTARHV